MEAEVFYDLVLANQSIAIDKLTALLASAESQIELLTFLCIVLLLTTCLNLVFFNRRV